VPGDAHLVFNVPPQHSAIFAFAVRTTFHWPLRRCWCR
jgi:hypothetical protein